MNDFAKIVKLLFNVTLKLLVLRRTFKVNLRLMSCQQLGSCSSFLTIRQFIFNSLNSVGRLSDELIIRSKELQLYYQYSKHHTRLNVSREMLLSSESHGAKVSRLFPFHPLVGLSSEPLKVVMSAKPEDSCSRIFGEEEDLLVLTHHHKQIKLFF